MRGTACWRPITIFVLFLIPLSIIACGTFEVGIARDAPSKDPPLSLQRSGIPTPTPAAPLPGIIYRTDEGVWKVEAGGQPVQLMDKVYPFDGPADEHYPVPAISPGGAYALYLGQDGDAATPEPAADQGDAASMRVSPQDDGDEAMLERAVDLWLINLATGERRNLTRSPTWTETDFRWWPARPDVVLCSARLEGGLAEPDTADFLAVVDIAGEGHQSSDPVRLGYCVLDDDTQSLPAPSPDGQTIAYGSGRTAWLYHCQRGREVFDPADYGVPSYREIHIAHPSWSPDGRKLAWMVSVVFGADRGTRMGVGVFDLETRAARILHLYKPRFEGAGAAALPYSWARSPTAAPVWSPDGQWLAFVAEDQEPDESGVWVVLVDDQGERGYTSLFTEYHLGGHNPVWSSDGRWLVFHRALPDGTLGVWAAQTGLWGLIRFALPPDAYIVDWMSPY